GDDRISGGAGNDVIDGGSGLDTAVFAGRREDFAISRASTHWGTADTNLGDGNEGSDRLVAVERLAFTDGQLALDLDGAAGHTVQIIRALFGPQYLDNEAFVGIGIALFDGGASYASVVELAVSAVPAFAGGASNEAFIRHVYRNVIGVAPGADELAYFNSLFDAGIFTQASLGLLACQIDINVNSVELIGLATTGIEFMPPA
ncbi:MAG TPA: hypothetical protein VLK61_26225, partial [Aquabacterium sp.]|nr:hypothetical protein [Aquabacterium sp.]